ncbi:hypothetical protein LINPERPRIM_LOCUS3258 [Linum perenne]
MKPRYSFMNQRVTKKIKSYEQKLESYEQSDVQPNPSDEAKKIRLRRRILELYVNELVKLGAASEEAFKIIQTGLKEIVEKLHLMEHKRLTSDEATPPSVVEVPEDLQGMKDSDHKRLRSDDATPTLAVKVPENLQGIKDPQNVKYKEFNREKGHQEEKV